MLSPASRHLLEETYQADEAQARRKLFIYLLVGAWLVLAWGVSNRLDNVLIAEQPSVKLLACDRHHLGDKPSDHKPIGASDVFSEALQGLTYNNCTGSLTEYGQPFRRKRVYTVPAEFQDYKTPSLTEHQVVRWVDWNGNESDSPYLGGRLGKGTLQIFSPNFTMLVLPLLPIFFAYRIWRRIKNRKKPQPDQTPPASDS